MTTGAGTEDLGFDTRYSRRFGPKDVEEAVLLLYYSSLGWSECPD